VRGNLLSPSSVGLVLLDGPNSRSECLDASVSLGYEVALKSTNEALESVLREGRLLQMATTMLAHETLGRMRGKLSEDGKTVQFRGIKYAAIPGRWQDPILWNEKLAEREGEFDATKHGPSCPQHPAGFPYDLSLVGNVALTRENEEHSEFECLNLIVVVPVESIGKDERLPVMVWYVL
jgi:Carboxylesterase family